MLTVQFLKSLSTTVGFKKLNLEGDTEGVEGTLLALVFLGMVLE